MIAGNNFHRVTLMIKTIRADERHFSDYGWLKTYWLFSFDTYHDPANLNHGALRVFNDDVVKPGTGFPTHSHREMEIITTVLSGEVTHEDSLGNRAVIRPGDVQRMTAGTGIAHSEYNRGSGPVHFYQIWIFPDERGLKARIRSEELRGRVEEESSARGGVGAGNRWRGEVSTRTPPYTCLTSKPAIALISKAILRAAYSYTSRRATWG